MIAGFIDGLTQAFLPTHLLAVAALGLLLGQSRRRVSLQLAAFALGLITGSLAIGWAVRETPAMLMLLALAACTGIVVALAWAPPPVVQSALGLIAGAAIALNSPPQAITIPAAIAAQAGTAVAALAMLAMIATIATQATPHWQRLGLRVVGSWIAASAILVLALRLAR